MGLQFDTIAENCITCVEQCLPFYSCPNAYSISTALINNYLHLGQHLYLVHMGLQSDITAQIASH